MDRYPEFWSSLFWQSLHLHLFLFWVSLHLHFLFRVFLSSIFWVSLHCSRFWLSFTCNHLQSLVLHSIFWVSLRFMLWVSLIALALLILEVSALHILAVFTLELLFLVEAPMYWYSFLFWLSYSFFSGLLVLDFLFRISCSGRLCTGTPCSGCHTPCFDPLRTVCTSACTPCSGGL